MKDLVGIPFKENGRSLEGFDCAGLVLYYLQQHGYRLPTFVSVFGNAEVQNQALLYALAEISDRIDAPEPLAVVTFYNIEEPDISTHVGIIEENGVDVLHCRRQSGVVRQSLRILRRRITAYYRVRHAGR